MKKLAFLPALAIALCLSGASAQETKVATLKADVKAKPTDAAASLALGRALRRAGRFNEAKLELSRAAMLGKGEDAVKARWELAANEWDSGKTNSGMPSPPSLPLCKQVKVGKDGEALSHACAAEAWLTMERTGNAEDELALAEKIDANLYEAKLARAKVLLVKGQHEDGVAKLKALGAATPNRAEAWFFLGKELLEHHERTEAVAPLRKAKELDGDWPDAIHELSLALPEGVEARDLARQAVAMRATWAAAWLRLGELELATGGFEAGKAAYETAIKQAPKSAPAHAGHAWAFVKLKKFDEAKKAAQEAINLAGNDANARLAMGEAHAGLGEVDDAVESFRLASTLDTKDPTGLVRAVEVLLAAKQPMKAEAHADAGVKAFPDDARIWNVKGDSDVANGDKKAARESYKKALSAKNGVVDKAAVQKKLDAIK